MLAACGSKLVQYFPSHIDNADVAAQIIEQSMYEQKQGRRPVSVFISKDFIGLSNGTLTDTSNSNVLIGKQSLLVGLGSSKTLTKELHQRIYFNSLGMPLLYTKNGRYVVQIRAESGILLLNVATLSEVRAKKLIDALVFFISISRNNEYSVRKTALVKVI